jgi:hypothetical protein
MNAFYVYEIRADLPKKLSLVLFKYFCYHRKTSPGAYTNRSDWAWAGEDLLGGMGSPATFLLLFEFPIYFYSQNQISAIIHH